MVDTTRLEGLISASGLKLSYIADKMGISERTLYNKIRNSTKFTARESILLSRILKIESQQDYEDIFFTSEVDS